MTKKNMLRAVCTLLLVSILLATFTFVTGAVEEDNTYSGLSVKNLYADEFLSSYTDSELSEVEGEYLRSQS